MKFLTYANEQQQPAIGVVLPWDTSRIIPLSAICPDTCSDLPGVLIDRSLVIQIATHLAEAPETATHRIEELTLLPVIPRPGKIVCMGLNYEDHAREGGNERPTYPAFFLRTTSSLTAHRQAILRPRVSTMLDFEAELAVVIGRGGRHLAPAEALDHVAGYTCFNDASVRDYQRKSSQWTIGKNFDATGAFGPWLVTPDELPTGAAGLGIRSRLNGRIMQDANTRDFLWSVAETLSLISACMSLEAGDVIITGTPAGVGYARRPPVWLKPGDLIEVEIDGIGTLANPVHDEAPLGFHAD